MTDYDKESIVASFVAEKLIGDAINAMDIAYAPYSEFKVGSALLTRNEKVYTGCNIENASFSATNCAERTAFFKAVSEGEKDFVAIAIVGGKNGNINDYCPPCGVCRQVIREFVDPSKFLVILGKSKEDYQVHYLEELLPMSFGPDNL